MVRRMPKGSYNSSYSMTKRASPTRSAYRLVRLSLIMCHGDDEKHRVIENAVGSATGNKASDLAKSFGFGDVASTTHNIAKNFVRDYLHTF